VSHDTMLRQIYYYGAILLGFINMYEVNVMLIGLEFKCVIETQVVQGFLQLSSF